MRVKPVLPAGEVAWTYKRTPDIAVAAPSFSFSHFLPFLAADFLCSCSDLDMGLMPLNFLKQWLLFQIVAWDEGPCDLFSFLHAFCTLSLRLIKQFWWRYWWSGPIKGASLATSPTFCRSGKSPTSVRQGGQIVMLSYLCKYTMANRFTFAHTWRLTTLSL